MGKSYYKNRGSPFGLSLMYFRCFFDYMPSIRTGSVFGLESERLVLIQFALHLDLAELFFELLDIFLQR